MFIYGNNFCMIPMMKLTINISFDQFIHSSNARNVSTGKANRSASSISE